MEINGSIALIESDKKVRNSLPHLKEAFYVAEKKKSIKLKFLFNYLIIYEIITAFEDAFLIQG